MSDVNLEYFDLERRKVVEFIKDSKEVEQYCIIKVDGVETHTAKSSLLSLSDIQSMFTHPTTPNSNVEMVYAQKVYVALDNIRLQSDIFDNEVKLIQEFLDYINKPIDYEIIEIALEEIIENVGCVIGNKSTIQLQREARLKAKKIKAELSKIPALEKENELLQQSVIDIEELVERATPKKVITKVNGIYYECPNKCGYNIIKDVHNYCFHCGQALDWSDSNDK